MNDDEGVCERRQDQIAVYQSKGQWKCYWVQSFIYLGPSLPAEYKINLW